MWFGSVQSQTITSDGDYTIYLTPTTTEQIFIYTIGTTTGSIDNVSVREVGQDWSLETGWSIGEDIANCINGSGVSIYQTNAVDVGKQYKLTFNVSNYSQGWLETVGGFTSGVLAEADGYYEVYGTAASTTFGFSAFGSFNGSITNISVKEVGQDWSVTNADANNYVEFGDGTARLKFLNLSPITVLLSTTTYENGKKYKLTVDVATLISGSIKFSQSGVNEVFDTTGVSTRIITPTSDGSIAFYRNTSNVDITLNSVSLIEITDDTNLPRINYEGFSYQDALGSEEVVNGGFDTNLNNWTDYGGTTISWESGGFALLDNDNGYWCKIRQSDVFEIGKTYRVILTAKSNIANKLFFSSTITGSFSQADTFETFEQYYTATTTAFEFGYHNVTGQNATITIDNVSVKEYLGQEVVPDSGCGSWLFEPQSTNLVTDSQNYNSTYWGGQRGTLSDGGVGLFYLSPTSNVIKYEVTTTGFNQLYYRLPSAVTIGNTYTQQGYVKCDDAPYIIFQIQPLTGNPSIVWDNINNVVISSDPSIDSFNITSLNGWVKAEITYTATVASIYASLKTYFSTTTSVTQGVPIGTIAYQTFVQVEQNSFSTSYIPTEGSTVTRNQDVCNNGGSLASINSTEGVIYWEGAKLQEASGTQVLGLSDGSGANRIGFQTSPNVNQIRFVVDAGGNQASKFFVLDDITDFNKYALKWKQDDFSFWVNGIKIGTDTSGNVPPLNALNTLDFYYGTGNGTGIYNFTAKTKALAVWKEALSDEELIALTS